MGCGAHRHPPATRQPPRAATLHRRPRHACRPASRSSEGWPLCRFHDVVDEEQRGQEDAPQQGSADVGHGDASEDARGASTSVAARPDDERRGTRRRGMRRGTGSMPAGAPGMAARQAADGEVRCRRRRRAPQRFERIGRTGRLEPAAAAQPGTQREPIGADRAIRNPAAARPSCGGHSRQRAASSSASSSTARRNAGLRRSAREQLRGRRAQRRRTIHRPGAQKRPRWRSAAA